MLLGVFLIIWWCYVFSENNLRDEWMIATLVLLDRLAQKKCTTSISKALPDDCAEVHPLHVEWLAAMLCVFKISSAPTELQIGLKDLIYRLVTDALDSASGWRFVEARYVFRNTSGAVRFMADGRLFLSSQGFPCSLP